jgi:hypothetical protein
MSLISDIESELWQIRSGTGKCRHYIPVRFELVVYSQQCQPERSQMTTSSDCIPELLSLHFQFYNSLCYTISNALCYTNKIESTMLDAFRPLKILPSIKQITGSVRQHRTSIRQHQTSIGNSSWWILHTQITNGLIKHFSKLHNAWLNR